MKDGKMRNPLCKRIIRELKRDWKKYLVVALFLILAIGFVSGMYVANGSMMQAAAVGKEKYHLEDGHFELDRKADQELIRAIETGEKADVKHFYPDQAKMELDDSEFSAVEWAKFLSPAKLAPIAVILGVVIMLTGKRIKVHMELFFNLLAGD